MLNKLKNLKRILASILLMLTIFSVVQPVLAVSSSGTGQWVPGQWDSNIYTTDNHFNVGVLIRRLVNYTTQERLTVFCAEHGVDSTTGQVDTATHIKPSDPKMKEASKVAYFGWYSKYGNYVVDGGILAADMNSRKMDYVFTQQMIWEVLGQSSATFRDSDIQSQYVAFRKNINNQMNRMKTKPSFSDTTVTLDIGETKTLTDTNGVFSDYCSIDRTENEIRFTHNKGENTLNITAGENCTIENYKITNSMMESWGLVKEETKDKDTTVYFQFKEGVQSQLYSMNYNDPVSMALSLNINLFGKLELQKLNTNGDLIDGAKFRVTGPNGYNQLVTVTNGKILLEKLKRGTYLISEESSPEEYLLNTETYRAEVKPNQTTTQAIVNDEPTGELTLIKTDVKTGNQNRVDGTSHHGDATLNGAVYTLYAKNDIYNKKGTVKYFNKDEQVATFTFNQYGVASIKITNNSAGLPMGTFYAKETTVPQAYKEDTNVYDEIFTFKDNKTKIIEVTGMVKNDVQKAPFEVIKVTTNDNTVAEYVADAEFTAILTKYVDFYGSFEEAKKHLNEFADDEYSVFRTGSNGHGVSGLLAYRKLYCK